MTDWLKKSCKKSWNNLQLFVIVSDTWITWTCNSLTAPEHNVQEVGLKIGRQQMKVLFLLQPRSLPHRWHQWSITRPLGASSLVLWSFELSDSYFYTLFYVHIKLYFFNCTWICDTMTMNDGCLHIDILKYKHCCIWGKKGKYPLLCVLHVYTVTP